MAIRDSDFWFALALLFAFPASATPPTVLDDFSGPLAGWTAVPSDGVALELVASDGALCLDFDFQGRGGWAIARKAVDLELPANYRLSFRLRGAGVPVNNLELKLLDASGENVWWKNRRDFEFPAEWTELGTKKRQIEFAWGPRGGGEPSRILRIEIGVVAGTGGAGRVCLDDLVLAELPPEQEYTGVPAVIQSAGRVEMDFGVPRELGGLTLRWGLSRNSRDYELLASDDLATWRRLRRVRGATGERDDLYLPETEARALRLELSAGDASELVDLEVRPLAFGASANAFFQALADEAPPGRYPRGFAHQQSYWTVVGVDGDREEALLSEDGALELGKGRGSLEPFIQLADGTLVGWPDVTVEQSLHEGDLPIPTVTWRHPRFRLVITTFADGDPEDSRVWVRYRLDNSAAERLQGRLALAIRPFQVNPPSQFLGTAGGVARIARIERQGSRIVVDDREIHLLTEPNAFGAATFDQGDAVEAMARGEFPAAQIVNDQDFGHASGVLTYDFDLAPGETRDVVMVVPLGDAEGRARAPWDNGAIGSSVRGGGPPWPPGWGSRPTDDPGVGATGEIAPRSADLRELVRAPQARFSRRAGGDLFDARLAATAASWRAKLDRVTISLPLAAGPVAATVRTALAHILINRDGAAIQPGSRAYERSWIRDGALTGAALLRFGHGEAVGEYLDWFAGHLFADGKVPCCVDARGADPVPENDSHGEFLHLVAEHHRFTGDRARAERLWPDVVRVVRYLDLLRQKRRTPEYQSAAGRAYFGLLPESISHEGYSARPVHSYWDDFWTLRGLTDAARLARELGRPEAPGFAALAEDFGRDLHASLRRTIAEHGLDYIPGSVELADFDATSSTIAIVPGGQLRKLPRPQIDHTFERYFDGVLARLGGDGDGTYTPYELRTVGTFARLGQSERAARLLEIFLADRRPPGWNQWPEVLRRDGRAPGFLGDLPHTWVASDFLRSVVEMLAYDDEDDHSLVLGAGLPRSWLADPAGVALSGLFTPHGRLGYRVEPAAGGGLRWTIEAGITVPPGGIELSWPFPRPPTIVTIDGRTMPLSADGRVKVFQVPAVVTVGG